MRRLPLDEQDGTNFCLSKRSRSPVEVSHFLTIFSDEFLGCGIDETGIGFEIKELQAVLIQAVLIPFLIIQTPQQNLNGCAEAGRVWPQRHS